MAMKNYNRKYLSLILPMHLPGKMNTMSQSEGNKISVFAAFLHQLWKYEIESDQGMILCVIPYPINKYLHTENRCDFHPRWNSMGNRNCFDAIGKAS